MSNFSRRPNLPVLYTTGSFYEVGVDTGKTFSDRIKGFWAASSNVQDILVPYFETKEGLEYYESTLAVCTSAFPQYIREIQGIADGCGLPFKNLFMLCLEKEVYNVLSPNSKKATSTGCTDIFINRPDCKILAHNEDAYHVIDEYGYFVSARIVENDEEVESFTAYCYPGFLPGCAFSFNRYGMVFSCDGLYPDHIVTKAPSRVFINRSIIKAKCKDEALHLLKCTGYGAAYGFTFNIADIKKPSTMWSIEIGPQEGESKMHVFTVHEEGDSSKPCHYIHTNSMQHLQDVVEIPDLKSSVTRKERADQMEPPRNQEAVLAILGDFSDPNYPLFRSPRPTDPSCTIITAVVNILDNKCDIYRQNPAKKDQRPLISFQIKDGSN